MLKKITLIIKKCLDCPRLSQRYDEGYICYSSLLNEETTPIHDIYIIPNWCPLENNTI